MLAQQVRFDGISNNLANANTTGYKRDVAVHKAVPELLLRRLHDDGVVKLPFSDGNFASIDKAPVVGKLGTGVEFNELFTIHEQGSLRQTAAPLDLALNGDGFFVVDTPEGAQLTRDGHFTRNSDGIIVNNDGHAVLGQSGAPLELKEHNFRIDQQGRVYVNRALQGNPQDLVGVSENRWEDEILLDQLQIVDVPRRRYLQKAGNNLWRTTFDSGDYEQLQPGSYRVSQGFVETANVNPIQELVSLIEVNRAYEANQRVIQAHDESTGMLLSRVLNA